MSSTNKTANLELSQYIDGDQPTYLGDYNADMLKIDTANGEQVSSIASIRSTADNASAKADTANTTATEAKADAAEAALAASQADTKATNAASAAATADSKAVSAQSTADAAQSAAAQAASAAATADGKAVAAQQAAGNAQTTANNALPKASLALDRITLPTPTLTIGGSPASYTYTNAISCLADPTFSFFKFYDAFAINLPEGNVGDSGRINVTFPGVIPLSARPTQSYSIGGCGFAFYRGIPSGQTSAVVVTVLPVNLTISTDGSIIIDCGVTANSGYRAIDIRLTANLYINGDLGDVPETTTQLLKYVI